jgi:uncharacterized membrane protein
MARATVTAAGFVPRLARRARDSLWALPLACMLAGVLLAVATLAIDRAADYELVPRWVTGTPTAAQTVLSTIATSMVTLITIVLTVTTVAVQLAMGQFSPRIVGALLQDRPSQLAHGLFAATFAFTVLAVSQVDDQAAGGGKVPGLTILVAYALVLASVVTLILYVHHAGQSLRVASMVDLVGDNLRLQLVERYPDPVPGADGAAEPRVIPAVESGVVVEVDERRLVEVAAAAECRLDLLVAMGDFVPAGAALFEVTDGDPSRLPEDLCALVGLGSERTHVDDPAYGFRKLVDIAERTASSSGGDPTTAVQAIDRLHDCLRYMACRDIPDGRHRDADGVIRLEMPVLGWDGYVRLSFDELRLVAGPSPQVSRRIEAALRDLWAIAPTERRPALERQLRLLAGEVERAHAAGDDTRAGTVADIQGIGSGPDVIAARQNSTA